MLDSEEEELSRHLRGDDFNEDVAQNEERDDVLQHPDLIHWPESREGSQHFSDHDDEGSVQLQRNQKVRLMSNFSIITNGIYRSLFVLFKKKAQNPNAAKQMMERRETAADLLKQLRTTSMESRI